MIPCRASLLIQNLIAQHMDLNKHIFIVGPPGSGKSVSLRHAAQLTPNVIEIRMMFSSTTNISFIADNLEYKLSQQRKKGKMMLLPPPQKSLLLTIDDVNLPVTDKWGAHPPIELLRQIIDQKGFYDQVALYFKSLESFLSVSVASPPGGGKSVLTERFTRHFNVFCMEETSSQMIQQIFNSLVGGFFQAYNHKKEITLLAKQLVSASLLFFKFLGTELKPTAVKTHYLFNLRDVGNVFNGIFMASADIFATKRSLSMFWAHETIRVYIDRMIRIEVGSVFRIKSSRSRS